MIINVYNKTQLNHPFNKKLSYMFMRVSVCVCACARVCVYMCICVCHGVHVKVKEALKVSFLVPSYQL